MRARKAADQTADQALEAGARTILGRPLTVSERADIHKYLTLLTKWNKVHRLVGSSDRQWLVANIVLDSFLFLPALPAQAAEVADLGSGAGVPGVPLALIRRDLHWTLIEARRKRVSFLSTVIRELSLSHVRLVGERAEAASNLAGAFDAVVSRCAGGDDVIVIGLGLLSPGGRLIVSGPPGREKSTPTAWVTVPGMGGSARRFAVYTKPS